VIEGVHIWRAALDEAGWPGPERLPDPERERFEGFLREQPRRRWLASRWALRRVLAGYLQQPAAAIELEAGEHGKPRLRGGEGLEFSLSHSEGLALVAVTTGREVGVDVEIVRPRGDLAALAERALDPEAVAAVRATTPERRAEVFHRAWVRHEARLKCLGVGLGGTPAAGTVATEEIEAAPGYAAAVAVAGSEVGPLLCRSVRAG
jgi:4'-phosphopantetheinyl transferase